MGKYKKILIFPDFSSSGIWNASDPCHVMIDYEDLGLPKKLVKQFVHWIYRMYDDGYKKDYSGLTKKAIKPVYEEGLRLSREVKKLFPDLEIEYWAEMGNCKLKKMKVK